MYASCHSAAPSFCFCAVYVSGDLLEYSIGSVPEPAKSSGELLASARCVLSTNLWKFLPTFFAARSSKLSSNDTTLLRCIQQLHIVTMSVTKAYPQARSQHETTTYRERLSSSNESKNST